MRTRLRLLVSAICILALMPISSPAQAAAGDLDNSFDGDGRTTTGFGGNEFGEAIAIQPDGRIVVAGSTTSGGDFALARYEPSGALDTSFDQDGRVTTDFAGSAAGNDVAIQSDGKIVVAGTRGSGSPDVDFDFVLARYNTNGSLDTTFSGDGRLGTGFGGDDFAGGVAIQPDGKIIVAGTGGDGSVDILLARYTTTGAIDTTFRDGGTVEQGLGGTEVAKDVALQPDGKIVVVGSWKRPSSGNTSYAPSVMVARFNSDGGLDTTFSGPDGFIPYVSGIYEAVAISAANQAIVAVGRNYDNNYVLSRLDFTGAQKKHAAFDFGGTDTAYGVAFQPDGKVVAAGSAGGQDFVVTRHDLGTLIPDTSFSGDGKAITNLGGSDEYAQAVAIQQNGKIVTSGHSNVTGSGDFAVARYIETNGADLSVTQSDNPDPVTMDNPLVYSITVTNLAGDPASSVLTDDLPDTVTFNSASPGCTHSTGIVTCDLTQLSAGQSRTVQISVTPTVATTITNNVSVVGSIIDPNTTNNADAETTTVMLTRADLSVTKADDPDPVAAGTNVTYTIGIANAGPDPATGVTLTDDLPDTLILVSATPSQGTCTGNVCSLGSIANGASASVTIVARATRTGMVTNTASVSAGEGDPDGTDNIAVEDTQVVPDADGCEIVGTDGNDVITGTDGADKICSLDGNDTVNAGGGADVVRGGLGDDDLSGEAGKDKLKGGEGADALDGGTGQDRCSGGPGPDTFKSCETKS